MKFLLEKKIIILVAISAVALIAVLVVYYFNAQQVKLTSKLVNHTQEILRKSDNILLDILNIESGSRGYILTGNDFFIKPFNNTVYTLKNDLKELARLTKDNSNQQLRIKLLENATKEKLLFTQHTIEVRKMNGLSESGKLMANGKGKILTDNIRKIVDEINNEELNLLLERKKKNINSNENANFLSLTIVVIIGLILLFVFIIIINQRSKNKFSQKLKKSNDLFSSLFNHNPASIFINSLSDGKIINANDSFLQLYGFKLLNEVIGKTSAELSLFVNSKHSEEIIELLKDKTILKDFETNIQTKQGELKWTSDSVLLLEVNNTICIFTVSTDITHRKKAEEQLIAVNKELEAFTYSVSHDLRAPLRAINGYAKILQEDYAEILNDDGIGSLNAIMKNSKKMGDLIDDLLAFSRLGKKVAAYSEINMTVLVKSVKEEELLNQTNKIEFIIPELIPAMGQQALIKQVWVNLISNAVKYSKHNIKIRIEIGSYIKNNLIVYFIKDNGAGFDMQYYDKLFGVFQRLHSQEEFEGTGIGLAIVQKIIHRHNGTVWAESKLNEGTCFYFSLPNINS